jgi:hypothetical protein
MVRKTVDMIPCEPCVQSGTYTESSSGLASLQHVTVGIAESRCTVGARRNQNRSQGPGFGSSCERPYGLTPATAKFPEEPLKSAR